MHSAKRPRTPTRQNRLELTAEAPGRRVHTTLLDYLRPLFTVDYEDCHSLAVYNRPHPGEFITSVYPEPNSISGRELADKPEPSTERAA